MKCPKFEHVICDSVVKLQKRFGGKKTKKNCQVPNVWHSAKSTTLGP